MENNTAVIYVPVVKRGGSESVCTNGVAQRYGHPMT
ncbi:UNVERIFIED_ORG: hypothetical protein J2Y81_007795 [Paraburkholderia sediminicola]|nr:hypothetical protein [Paraburkholderia sediminicola]